MVAKTACTLAQCLPERTIAGLGQSVYLMSSTSSVFVSEMSTRMGWGALSRLPQLMAARLASQAPGRVYLRQAQRNVGGAFNIPAGGRVHRHRSELQEADRVPVR